MKKVKFGNYWQTNDEVKEPIKWFVLAEKDGKSLLLSKYALDCKPFNQSCCKVAWEECTLRKWLHSTFINNAFSEEEQQAIVLTKNKTNGSRTTEDKIFLLSTEEALEYLPKKKRKCTPTPYAKLHNAWSNDDNFCHWWLRSPGFYQDIATYVDYDGDVLYNGFFVNYDFFAIRVALWINNKVLNSVE